MLNKEKIRLRAVEPEDSLMMYDVENDATVWFCSLRQAPLSMHALSKYAHESGGDPFAEHQLRLVIETGDELPVGLIDLYDIRAVDRTAMVGVVILEQYRGCGIAGTALSLIEDYSRKVLHLRAIAAHISADNEASIRLFKSAGYTTIGTMPKWLMSPNGAVDMVIVWRELK